MILMWIIVIGFGIAVTALSAIMVVLSQVLTVAAIIFAVINFLVMLALVIVIIVLTRKGKFSRDFLGRLRESAHGAWKYWGMRILQIVLWVMAVWSLIMTAVCILCAVMKPLDFLITDTSKLCFVMSIL